MLFGIEQVFQYLVVAFFHRVASEDLVFYFVGGFHGDSQVGVGSLRIVGLAVYVGQPEIIVGAQKEGFAAHAVHTFLLLGGVARHFRGCLYHVVGHVDIFVVGFPLSVLGIELGVVLRGSYAGLPGGGAEHVIVAVVHGVVDAVTQILFFHFVGEQMEEHAGVLVVVIGTGVVHGQITVAEQQLVEVCPTAYVVFVLR